MKLHIAILTILSASLIGCASTEQQFESDLRMLQALEATE